MKKRKTTGPKPAKTKPLSPPNKPGQSIPLFWTDSESFPRFTPPEGSPYWTGGMNLLGITVPPDLDKAIEANGNETWSWIFDTIESEPWRFFDYFPELSGERYAEKFLGGDPRNKSSWELIDLGDPRSWQKDARGLWRDHIDFSYAECLILHAAINTAMAQGFFLALRRYAEDLKHVPEAAALLEKEQTRKETARRNGKVRAEKAAPTHKAIRKRFRELRKTIPKKTVRYLRVAKEFGKSDRHIARIVDGID